MKITNNKATLLTVVLFLNLICSLIAQVPIEGRVATEGKNILLGVYSQGVHELVPIGNKGDFSCLLERYEECLLVFYERGAIPQTFSINTDNSSKVPIKLNIQLESKSNIDISQVRLGPKARYVTNGSDYNQKVFNLDGVKDKARFATLMTQVSRDMEGYYKHSKIPAQRIGHANNPREAELMKTEHRLGQEIYQLLTKKRAREAEVERLRSEYNYGEVSDLQQCNVDLTLLKKEASLYRTSAGLAEKQLEKEKMIVKRKESAGKTVNNNAVNAAAKRAKNFNSKKEIATLNMKNKQADCWEIKLLAEQEKQQTTGASEQELKLKQLEISDVRYKQRLNNAYALMKQHNELANNLTGRERVVELANAQKYISDIEEVKLYKVGNNLKRWQYKDNDTGQYLTQINKAKAAHKKQRDYAFQAEMAYLEHLWHLRGKPELHEGELDDLFVRQNQLLAVPKLDRANRVEEEEEVASLLSDEEVLSVVKISESSDATGKVKKVSIIDANFEIKVDTKGRKVYSKNGNPITQLTYQFETKRKFGEIVENITEDERKSKLFKLYRKKIE